MQLEKEFQKALTLHRNGNIDEAKAKYEKIIKNNKGHFNAIHMLGVVAYQKKNLDLAVNLIEQAIKLNDTIPSFYNNLGNAYKDLKKFNQAINSYEKVYQLDKNHFGSLHNLGIVYSNIGDYDKALFFYEEALKINPRNSDTYINRGKILCDSRRYYESFLEFNKAILINENEKVYNARGALLTEWGRYNQALEDFNKSISINPEYAETYDNRGACFYKMEKYNDALQDFEKAYLLNKNITKIIDKLLAASIRMCNWQNHKKRKHQIIKLVEQSKDVDPFFSLCLFDDPKLHFQISNNYIKNHVVSIESNKNFKYEIKDKINIGYYSPDFYDHPISHLSHEIFKNHDCKKFNIFGFDLKGKRNNEIHKKIKNSFGDNFFYVDQMSEAKICELSQNLKIDIAVDLAGHTAGSRIALFRKRFSPIQINYLGYPGTIGSDLYDYILADHNLITCDQFKFYNEKIVYLPNCYQTNESFDKSLNLNFSRKDFNIPEDFFVYCCFNSNWKYTPEIFDSWSRILKSVNKSVLWLLASTVDIKENLLKEALNRGVEKEKIIFADFLPRKDHINRQKLANLFLDTYPYTAHTTCSDSLRSYVPVLTIKGTSFQSRVSSSILKSCFLDELVTDNFNEYENLAIKLGKDQLFYNKLKSNIIEKVPTSVLFDNKLFTKNLENSYEKIFNRFKSGLSPDHIIDIN